MRDLIWGAMRVPAAFSLLRRQRKLWPWCVLPFVLNLVLFGLAIGVFFAYSDDLAASLSRGLPIGDPEVWYEWLWVGPFRALAWLLRWLLLLLAAFLVYFLFAIVGSVIASPLLDVLSQEVEKLHTGRVHATGTGAVRAALKVAFEDAKRTAFFLIVQVGVLALGLVPGLQPIAAALAFGVTALFLSLDYTAYVLDRREVSFRARRAWLWKNKAALFGFGAAAFFTFVIPGLNFLSLPVLVTAGTVTALELELPDG